MEIILYKNTAERNRVNKSNYISIVGTVRGTLRTSVSITKCVISIEGEPNFNYVYIPEFNRYYFVDDFIIVNNKLIDVSISVDVLMSYYNQLINLSAFIDRSQNTEGNNEPYLTDNKIVIKSGVDYEEITIENNRFLNTAPLSSYTMVINGYKFGSIPLSDA